MRQKRFMTATRTMTVALTAIALIFGGMAAFTYRPPETVIQLPYVGMTLAYDVNKTIDIGASQVVDLTQTIISYVSKTPSGLFQVYAYEELFVQSFIVNSTSREIVSGVDNGTYIGHLIPTNLSIGDIVMVNPRRNFTVTSTNDTYEIRKGSRVTAFRLLYHQEWVKGDVNYSQTIIRYYDAKYGLLLQELDNDVSYNPGYNAIAHHFKVTLVDDETNDNGYGLSTFQRLFANAPDNTLLVGELILASLAAAGLAVFFFRRKAINGNVAEKVAVGRPLRNSSHDPPTHSIPVHFRARFVTQPTDCCIIHKEWSQLTNHGRMFRTLESNPS